MGFYSIDERKKWLPHVKKKIKDMELSKKAIHFLTDLNITHLDYGEFHREEVIGEEIITWYMDFTYEGKNYEYRRSEVLETGSHLCYGYFLKEENNFFDDTLIHKIGINEAELYEVLEVFDEYFHELT